MVNSIGGIQMKVPFKVPLTHPWYKKIRGKPFRPESIILMEKWWQKSFMNAIRFPEPIMDAIRKNRLTIGRSKGRMRFEMMIS